MNKYKLIYVKLCKFATKPKMFDKKIYIANKEYSATFNEGFNIYKTMLYDLNLKNLMNSLHVVRRDFENIVFYGSNPITCLLNLPSGT